MSVDLPPRWARAWISFCRRHGVVLWVVALLLAVPATIRTVGLYSHLNTDVEALLPRESASVRAIDELRSRISGIQNLGVVIDSGDAQNLPAAEQMLADLADKVRSYPPGLIQDIRLGPKVEHDFINEHGPLYFDVDDLKTIRSRITARRDYEVEKASGLLLDESTPAPPIDFDDIEKKYRGRIEGADRFPNGRFSSTELHATVLVLEVGTFSTGQGSDTLLRRVQDDVKSLGRTDHYAPNMRIGYSGDVPISVEETAALKEDLSISSVIVLLGVLAVIVAYYRWWWSVAVLFPPLLLATVLSFGLASLPPIGVTELNTNTAFLGSIIVGNGINFAIVFCARYVEERRGGAEVDRALEIAIFGAYKGTLVAALAAGVSYASLCLTEFRGFRQFGFIGGIGMVMCWISGFVLMPSLIGWIDGAKRAPKPLKQGSKLAFMEPLSRLVTRRPWPIVAAASILVALSIAKVSTWSTSQIEYDLSRLRRADTWTSGEGYWGGKMDAVLGEYLTPTVLLADDPAQARAAAAQVREAMKKAPLEGLIASVRTLDDVLPADQEKKLVEINAIRALLKPRILKLVPEEKREAVNRFATGAPASPVTIPDLPPAFTLGMRERDGSYDKTVLVYPRPGKLWVGPTITTFVDGIRKATVSPDGHSVRVAGSLPLSADIFRSLARDGPLATGLAFGGVTFLVLLVFRRSWVGLAVVGSLLIGVLWLAGLSMALGVRLNFTNFIAYPITFGIGVDYSVNVMARYVQDGSKDVAQAIRSTGGAVVLCSLTTTLGYSSLLLAKNRALCLFGLLAVLGEVACLTTAVVVLPAVLSAFRRPPKPAQS